MLALVSHLCVFLAPPLFR
jgi:ribosomal protein L9